jgi:hypothetical protein
VTAEARLDRAVDAAVEGLLPAARPGDRLFKDEFGSWWHLESDGAICREDFLWWKDRWEWCPAEGWAALEAEKRRRRTPGEPESPVRTKARRPASRAGPAGSIFGEAA